MITVSCSQNAQIPDGIPVVSNGDDGPRIWPQGVGVGPLIMLSWAEWDEISARVAECRKQVELDRVDR